MCSDSDGQKERVDGVRMFLNGMVKAWLVLMNASTANVINFGRIISLQLFFVIGSALNYRNDMPSAYFSFLQNILYVPFLLKELVLLDCTGSLIVGLSILKVQRVMISPLITLL